MQIITIIITKGRLTWHGLRISSHLALSYIVWVLLLLLLLTITWQLYSRLGVLLLSYAIALP